MGAGAVIATAAIGGVIARLVADDLKAWTPRGIAYLIRRATSKLPDDRRERLAEEWQSHISETPGDIAKIITAVGFLVAARRIARERRQGRSAWAEKTLDVLFEVGARYILRRMLKNLALDLSKLCGPAELGPIMEAVRSRFEPSLRADLRDGFARRRGPREQRDTVLETLKAVLIDVAREDQTLRAVLLAAYRQSGQGPPSTDRM